MLVAALTDPVLALSAVGLVVIVAIGTIFHFRRKAPSPPGTDKPVGDAAKLENYQLILDTLDRSNVLLWWAKVTRSGSKYDWKIRTPPQLSRNPIFRLAALAGKGWLWKNEQSPDHERMNQTSTRAIAGGASGYQHEFPIIGADAMHWLSEEVIIRPAGPDEWNLAGVIVDVTNRHEAEEARRATEGQLNQILNGADCLIWQAVVTGDPDTHIKWHMFVPPSALFKTIFGDGPAPSHNLLWTESMVPEWDQIKDLSRRALREGWPDYEQEFHVVTPGRTLCVHEHVSVTPLEPGRWNLVGVIVDITARRDAETALAAEKERLAVTLGSMNEGVVTIDARGCILFINRAAAEMVQWAAAEAVGREVFEVCRLQEASSSHEMALPVRAVLEGGAHADLPPQTLLRGRRDRLQLVEGRVVPFADKSSKRVGAVLVLRDVTERHRMEEELQHAGRLESIGILAGGIAHDFNNILTAILSNLSLLELDLAGMPAESRLLDEAVRATKRAGDLTLQLLTFAKGGDPVRTAVNLGEIVREAATFAHRGTGVMSNFELPPGLWAASADKAQISQVVQNLVINATQAMPGGGMLRISASNEHVAPASHASLAPGEYVRISVADTGEGIAPESLGKIFDPYFTTKRLGHGLGLATVFSIIKRHKGHIEVASALGKGTTFTFWLPASPAAVPEADRPKAFAGAGAGGRVLFMDDEEPILRMAAQLMARMGCHFESARDGREAIDRYRAAKEAGRPFDLVVMDLTIPGGMGGKEAISILRQFDPDVRAIVSSGYSSDLAMADFREHGFRGMVAKPYDINELATVVRAVIGESAEPAARGDRG
jgi:PAS domain S-box-containing protein